VSSAELAEDPVPNRADIHSPASSSPAPSSPEPSSLTPAATVACLRPGDAGPEVLILRRRSKGAFGGMWVFPGGKVDAEDWALGDDEVAAARTAAVREAREEAALVVDPGSLVTLSYWLPPAQAPRRYSTWFFLAPVVGVDPIVLSEDEVREHRWQRPVDILAAHSAGEVRLAPPTWMTLSWLAGRPSVDDALAAAATRPPERFLTKAVVADGGLVSTLWEGDVAYDDLDLDPDRPGARRRLLVTPDGWRFLDDAGR
jgi:8-oxo-dGTP pyrophosphatase MutT (NUDIX family)